MRKIRAHFFISPDATDAMLMGRILYDEWAAYRPEHVDEPFGDVMSPMNLSYTAAED